MTGHIITPEGKEIAATKDEWNKMPADWKSMACFIECDGCTTEKGEAADHAAGCC